MLFLDVAEGEGRQQVVLLEQAVREAFGSSGLRPHDSRPFQPHVTIAKMSKMKGRGTWLLVWAMYGCQLLTVQHADALRGITVLTSVPLAGMPGVPAACCVARDCNSSACGCSASDSSAVHLAS